jgi:hypothetical protein
MQAWHCGMFAVDIASFGRRQDPAIQRHLRSTIHRIVRESCDAIGLPWDKSHHEDRGDGLFVIVHPQTSIEDLLGPLVTELLAGTRAHNKISNLAAQIRLRVAIHAGYIHLDEHGATGPALIHLFRLLNAPAFRAALDDFCTDLVLIVSDYLYEEVIAYNPGLIQADTFQPLAVQAKETNDRGWLWLPPAHPRTGRARSAPVADNAEVIDVGMALLAALDELIVCISRPTTEADQTSPPVIHPAPVLTTIESVEDGDRGRRFERNNEQVVALLVAMKQRLSEVVDARRVS